MINLKQYCENNKHCPYSKNIEWSSSVDSWVRVSSNKWEYNLEFDLNE